MKVIALVENKEGQEGLKVKQGLSLYIEAGSHKILFDVGPDDTFLKNAQILGVPIEEVDTVILSHGHRDHGGGLKVFLEHNKQAKVYVQESAWHAYYVNVLGIIKVAVGLDQTLKEHPQIHLLKGNYCIDEELQVFTEPRLHMLIPEGNKVLLEKKASGYEKDTFVHEQNLILTAEGKKILVAGCAHRGITNIINEAERMLKSQLDVIMSGMHTENPVSIMKRPSVIVGEVGEVLRTKQSLYYTCHCTGEAAYKQLKEALGDQIDYLWTGKEITI